SQSQSQLQSQIQTRSKIKPQSQAHTQIEMQTQIQTQTLTQVQTQVQTEPAAKIRAKTKVKAQLQTKELPLEKKAQLDSADEKSDHDHMSAMSALSEDKAAKGHTSPSSSRLMASKAQRAQVRAAADSREKKNKIVEWKKSEKGNPYFDASIIQRYSLTDEDFKRMLSKTQPKVVGTAIIMGGHNGNK
ncbi:capicua-like transcription factor, partial [Reticulomyxa filosa]